MQTIYIKDYVKLSHQEQVSFIGIIRYDEGTISYIKNGEYHRLDGPAVCEYGEEEYWINGKLYTKEDWQKHPEVIRNSKQFKDVLEYKNL